MGIKTIFIDDYIPLKNLLRLVRKAAMTGGFEIEISKDIQSEQLNQLVNEMINFLKENYKEKNSFYKASVPYMVLSEIIKLKSINPEQKKIIEENL